MPWGEAVVDLYRGEFPQPTPLLPDAEAAQYRLDLNASLRGSRPRRAGECDRGADSARAVRLNLRLPTDRSGNCWVTDEFPRPAKRRMKIHPRRRRKRRRNSPVSRVNGLEATRLQGFRTAALLTIRVSRRFGHLTCCSPQERVARRVSASHIYRRRKRRAFRNAEWYGQTRGNPHETSIRGGHAARASRIVRRNTDNTDENATTRADPRSVEEKAPGTIRIIRPNADVRRLLRN